MNREIKFRGKSVNSGKWVYAILHGFGMDWFDECVIESTIGQFTGLYDKNGKEIYEGDIVKTREYGIDTPNGAFCSNVAGYDKFQIKWDNGGFHLSNDKREFRLCRGSHLEVLGNIHDSPGLLKGKHL